MAALINKCIFCGSSKITGEHIFSHWTHKYLPPRKRGKAVTRVGTISKGTEIFKDGKMPGAVRDWKVEAVCGGTHLTCNGGWMRDVENIAKPALLPLLQGSPTALTQSDQRIVATWAVLKNMVAQFHYSSNVSTHWIQRRRMMTKHLPPEKHWTVWIGHYDRGDWRPEWLSNSFFFPSAKVQARRGVRQPTYYNGACTTQVIGKLFIHIIHFPHDRVDSEFIRRAIFPPTNGAIFCVWPSQVPTIAWPQTALSDIEADRIAGALFSFLRKNADG